MEKHQLSQVLDRLSGMSVEEYNRLFEEVDSLCGIDPAAREPGGPDASGNEFDYKRTAQHSSAAEDYSFNMAA
jgi:hypothetical protein